jgi:hypothetical protein
MFALIARCSFDSPFFPTFNSHAMGFPRMQNVMSGQPIVMVDRFAKREWQTGTL